MAVQLRGGKQVGALLRRHPGGTGLDHRGHRAAHGGTGRPPGRAHRPPPARPAAGRGLPELRGKDRPGRSGRADHRCAGRRRRYQPGGARLPHPSGAAAQARRCRRVPDADGQFRPGEADRQAHRTAVRGARRHHVRTSEQQALQPARGRGTGSADDGRPLVRDRTAAASRARRGTARRRSGHRRGRLWRLRQRSGGPRQPEEGRPPAARDRQEGGDQRRTGTARRRRGFSPRTLRSQRPVHHRPRRAGPAGLRQGADLRRSAPRARHARESHPGPAGGAGRGRPAAGCAPVHGRVLRHRRRGRPVGERRPGLPGTGDQRPSEHVELPGPGHRTLRASGGRRAGQALPAAAVSADVLRRGDGRAGPAGRAAPRPRRTRRHLLRNGQHAGRARTGRPRRTLRKPALHPALHRRPCGAGRVGRARRIPTSASACISPRSARAPRSPHWSS